MMVERKCTYEGCGRPFKARGLCSKHYQRLLRHGDPNGGNREIFMSPEEAFESRTMPVTETACLLWTGKPNRDGYGRIANPGGSTLAHRYAWEQVNGDIPKGLVIDHMCHTPQCVNVDHLRLATHGENMRNRPKATSQSKTRVRGVDLRPNGYRASVTKEGKHFHIGYFPTLAEAEGAVKVARDAMFGEFAGKG